MSELSDLVQEAVTSGWASTICDLEQLKVQARALRWTEQAPRRGDPTETILRPTPTASARARSLSAVYGFESQPLHTDGAHLTNPPDFVLLFSERPNLTPTLLWRPALTGTKIDFPLDALRHGMFLIENGKDSFFAPAFVDGRYRFDPGCMTACDQRASIVQRYLTGCAEDAMLHTWASNGQVLIIDNHKALHARAQVVSGDDDRRVIRIAYLVES